MAGGVTGSWLPSWLGWVSAVVPGRTPKWEAMLASVVRQAVTWRVPGYDVQ